MKLDVIGKLVTLSEREAGELREVAAADAGRSSARRDLSLLLERGLRTKTTVALSRGEARELVELLTSGGFGSNLALLREAEGYRFGHLVVDDEEQTRDVIVLPERVLTDWWGSDTTGYRGPCPPPGHGRHRYVFRLYALEAELELGAGAAKTSWSRRSMALG